MLYSRGFASIYGEWETTDEAKTANRTFHESLRFPCPATPVQVVVKKRDARNVFRECGRIDGRPGGHVRRPRRRRPAPAPLIEIHESGDPRERWTC